MELLTQGFLRGGWSIADLETKYGITAKRHGEFPNLVFLKYNQLTSPMHEPIVQECRGLILDEADNWRVVSFPFRKFFNAHEPNAAVIDWSTARVYEKLDGSLMTMYWYRDAWRVASNGTPDGSGNVYGHRGTFADLFWETYGNGRTMPRRGFCYMFELMTPYNRVVVPHRECNLKLIGARDIETLEEMQSEFVAIYHGFDEAKSFSLRTISDCLVAAERLNPMQSEGYVVVDASWNRIKVKCPQYVALSRLKESMSPRHMLDLVRKNEGDEFLSYFPEMRPLYEGIKAQYDRLCASVDDDYQQLKHIAEQKAFALEAAKTRCSGALFAIRGGKAKNAREYFAGVTIQNLERTMPPLPAVEAYAALTA